MDDPQKSLTIKNYCFTLIYASKKRINMHPSLQQAKRLSRLMKGALLVIGLVLAGIAVYLVARTLIEPAWITADFKSRNRELAYGSMSGLQTAGLLALSLMQIVLLLGAVYALRRTFGTIASSEGININTALWIRRSGLAFAATSLAMVLSVPVGTAIGSWGQAPGQRFISISFDAPQLLAFLLAAVLIILGHVLALAADIAEDNRQIV
jgi:hypothetical protein